MKAPAIIFMVLILYSCNTGLGSQRLNDQLDHEIKSRLTYLKSKSTAFDPSKIDSTISLMSSSVTLADGCERSLPIMDGYFRACARVFKISDSSFVQTTLLDTKPDILLALKLNELVLLDHFILQTK